MPMIVFVHIVIVVVCLPFIYFGIVHLLPWINKGFSLVWQDPTARQRDRIMRRLRAVLLGDGIPAETAVLMVAKEHHVTEYELLGLLGLNDARDVHSLFAKSRGGWGGFLNAVDQTFRRGT
ncbi:MAG: hypothetical protein SF051_05415 [Elusimicrobiota bacterium]|nr:hypothetical protein [Elusimicrobiota bacterium]